MVASLFWPLGGKSHTTMYSTNDFQPRSGDCEWRGSRNNGSCRTVEEDTPSPNPEDRMRCSGRSTKTWWYVKLINCIHMMCSLIIYKVSPPIFLHHISLLQYKRFPTSIRGLPLEQQSWQMCREE